MRGGEEFARLQPQAVSLLLVLVENAGQVVSREELHRRLWPDTSVDFEDGLRHAVARLRDALHDSAQAPRFIETVPRRGYRFIAPVEYVPAEAPPSARALAPADPTTGRPSPADAGCAMAPEHEAPPARRRSSWPWIALATGVAVLAIVATVPWRGWSSPGISSIVVLPFANLSNDSSQDFFADGVADELITELARIEGLRVVSRTSARTYAGTRKSVPDIATELNVDAVVEGAVQRSGSLVRVTVQLIRAVPESHLWARTFEVGLDELFPLRTQVAAEIADQVGKRLRHRGAGNHDVSPAAHAAYAMGWNFARQASEEGYRKSLEYFEQALALDPQYALAYSQLAESHAMLDYIADQRGEHFERAWTLARRALELAPDLPEARLRVADLKFYWDWDWRQCDTEFRAARDLAPDSPDVREHYALCLVHLGRFEEARPELQRALELEPLSARAHWRLAESLVRAGALPQAISESRRAADLRPGDEVFHSRLARTLLLAGRGEEALGEFVTGARLRGAPDDEVAALQETWRTKGEAGLSMEVARQTRATRVRRLADLQERARTTRVSTWDLACAYADVGDADHAIAELERGIANRSPRVFDIKAGARWDPYRADPRFVALVQRLNFTEH